MWKIMLKNIAELWKELPMWIKILSYCSIVVLVIILGSCGTFWKSYPEDNIIENSIENVIESESGLKIDLSPFSPEDENRWKNK
mgnify:CR=1 FL=1